MTKPRNIILAEDDADDRDLFLEAISLIDPDVKVATVENGEKLMHLLARANEYPDCIFLDLNMPRKSGKACLQEIKENQRTHDIPVVIYTTSRSNRDIDETFDKGASCYIRKPASFGELKDLLRLYLQSAFDKSRCIKGNFVLNSP